MTNLNCLSDKIRNWQESVAVASDQIANECTTTFLVNINSDNLPTSSDLERAVDAVNKKALPLITSDVIFGLLAIEQLDLNAKKSLCTNWLNLMPKLVIPAPNSELVLPPRRLAIASALGSLLGMLIFGGLLHWTLNMRDVGILFGGIIGAATMVYSIWYVAHNEKVRNELLTFVGVATTVEFFATFFSWLRKFLDDVSNLGKRLLLYASIMALLAFIRLEYKYDRTSFERVVQQVIGQWVAHGLLLLFSLANTEHRQIVKQEVLDPALARAIIELHKSDIMDLPLAAEEVLREARRLGLDGLSDTPQFVNKHTVTKRKFQWEERFKQQYQCFGVIEHGDMVSIEKEPVQQNSVITERGLVRKVRNR